MVSSWSEGEHAAGGRFVLLPTTACCCSAFPNVFLRSRQSARHTDRGSYTQRGPLYESGRKKDRSSTSREPPAGAIGREKRGVPGKSSGFPLFIIMFIFLFIYFLAFYFLT